MPRRPEILELLSEWEDEIDSLLRRCRVILNPDPHRALTEAEIGRVRSAVAIITLKRESINHWWLHGELDPLDVPSDSDIEEGARQEEADRRHDRQRDDPR